MREEIEWVRELRRQKESMSAELSAKEEIKRDDIIKKRAASLHSQAHKEQEKEHN